MSTPELNEQAIALLNALTQLQEDTTVSNASNIATTDENLSVDQMYQQTMLPSLGKQIFSILPMNGPTAAIFNIRKKESSNNFELVRNEVEVFPTESIKTGLTQETVQDIRSQFGKTADGIIGTILRGLTNEQENEQTLDFLDNKCLDYGELALSSSLNAENNLFEITQRVQEIILKINSLNQRSYEAFAVIPYQGLGGVMALSNYATSESNMTENGLFIAKIGLTKYFLNPDATSTTAYVGIKDTTNPSKSSAVFSPYISTVTEVPDADTGDISYHIFNRFAITESPLHVTDNEMLYKFTITA